MVPQRPLVLVLVALVASVALVHTQTETETVCPTYSSSRLCRPSCLSCAAPQKCCRYGRCYSCEQPVVCPQPASRGNCSATCEPSCSAEDVCCSNGCGQECTRPLRCPPTGSFGSCAIACGDIQPCTNGTLCCPTACGGRTCQQPV